MRCFYERTVGTKGQNSFCTNRGDNTRVRILILNDSRCITLIDHFQRTLYTHIIYFIVESFGIFVSNDETVVYNPFISGERMKEVQ